MTYRKYFQSNDNSYRQIVIDGKNAKHEVYNALTDKITTTWNLPVTKTMFRSVKNLIKTCKQNKYIQVV